MEFKINNALDIPGWTRKSQHDLYKNLVQELPKNPKILEIGCGWGRSTWAWLDVLPSNSTYCVLDNFSLSSQWCYQSQYRKYKGRNPINAQSIRKWKKEI